MNSRRPDKRVSTLIINHMSNNGSNPTRKMQTMQRSQQKKRARKPRKERELKHQIEMHERAIKQLLGSPNRVLSDTSARNFHNTGLGADTSRSRPSRRDKKEKSGPSRMLMAPGFQEFLKANSSAFSNQLAPPFATTNPQASIANRASRATQTTTISVAAGEEIVFTAGVPDTISMDGNAYHIQAYLDVFGSLRWSGPFNFQDGANLINSSLGIQWRRQALGAVCGISMANLYPMFPNTEWPITPTSAIGNATQRYVPTCWTIQVLNETVIQERGGDFVTCLPASSSSQAGLRVEDLVRFGSYREHGANECILHVPARPVDLAYRHLVSGPAVGGTATMTNPAGWLAYRNTTGKIQTLRVYAGTKYTIAGSLPAALLAPADHSPHHSGHYENVSAAITAGMAHPTNLQATGKAVMQAIHQGKSVLEAIGQKGLDLADEAAMKAISAASRSAGFQV